MSKVPKQRRSARRDLALSARWSAPLARPTHLVKLTLDGAVVRSRPARSLEEADRIATGMRSKGLGLGYDVLVMARSAAAS